MRLLPKKLLCMVLVILAASGWSAAQGLLYDYNLRQGSDKPPALQMLVGEHYQIIYFKGHENLAEKVLQLAGENTINIENLLGFRLSGKINIQLFETPLSKIKFQNRLAASDNIFYNIGGVTPIPPNVFEVVYDGSMASVSSQIRAGITRVLLTEMLYGGTVQEKIKYASLLQLPAWFVDGLVAYTASPWNTTDDERLRNIVLNTSKMHLADLRPEEQALAGKHIWFYMAMLKGEGSFQRMLYLVRLTRKVENALYFVFNWNTNRLIDEWHQFALGIYARDTKRMTPTGIETLKKTKGSPIRIFFIEDTMYLQYMRQNESYLVYYNASNKKYVVTEKVTLAPTDRFGALVPEYFNYKGRPAKLIYTHNAYKIYILSGNKWHLERELAELDYINGIEAVSESNQLIINGLKGGINNIVLLNENSSEVLFQSDNLLTDVKYSIGRNGIYFTQLITDGIKTQSDIFFKTLNKSDTPVNITQTIDYNEKCAVDYFGGYITYLSDADGIFNSVVKKTDAAGIKYLTDYMNGIHNICYNIKLGVVAEVLKYGEVIQVSLSSIDTSEIENSFLNTPIKSYFRELPASFALKIKATEPDTSVSDTNSTGIYFQVDYPEGEYGYNTWPDSVEFNKFQEGMKPFTVKSPLFYYPDLLITRLDNSWLNTMYVPTYLQLSDALNIPVGLLVGVNYKNINNKSSLYLGGRVARNFNKFDYILRYDSYYKQMPVKVEFFRSSKRVFNADADYQRVISDQLSLEIVPFWGKRFTLKTGLVSRIDSRDYLSTGVLTAAQKGEYRWYNGLMVNYVYNNSYGKDPFNRKGLRACVYSNFMLNATSGNNISFFGLDARHGTELIKNMYLMNRVQAESSAGAEKVTYVIGGMENWISSQLTSESVLMPANGYFRMAPLRGFNLNHRNGNSYAMYTAEIRYKPVGSVINLNTRSDFLNYFTLTAFCDAGMAWYGNSPYNIKSPLNNSVITTGSMQINVYNKKDPMMYGLGFGLRTKIFGYLIKLDVAKGYSNGLTGNTIRYFSLGRDF